MEWISGWIQGIVIAVIISTIIEMILPEGTSKKYIKVVIGVYILFSIVSPVISKFTGNDFKVSNFLDLDEYIEASKNSGSLQNKLEDQNQTQIKDIYLSSIKSDIREKIRNKGYTVKSIEVEVEDDEQYTLKKLTLQIEKETTDNTNETESSKTINSKENQKVDTVNEVKIDIGNVDSNTGNNVENKTNAQNSNSKNKSSSKQNNISSQEKRQLKEYLSGVYEISTKNVFINE